MKHSVENKGDFAVLHLAGEVDMNNSAEAREAMLGCLAEKRHLIVDMHEVEYIDSSGIAGLIEAYQTAKSSNLQFRLAQISGAVRRVLELAHLDRVFPIRDSIEDAMEDGG